MPILFRGREFRPSAFGLVAAAAACVITVLLGNWQMRRAEEKIHAHELREAAERASPRRLPSVPFDPAAYFMTKVRVRGVFDESQTYLLDNRARNGRPGYEVLTPLRIKGTDRHVLVLRGWVAGGATRDAIPAFGTPRGEYEIEGLAIPGFSRVLEPPGTGAQGRVRQNMTIEGFAVLSGLSMVPVAIEQHSDMADGLVRNWPRADSGADKNTAYAMQWYAFAMLAVVLAVVLSFRRQVRDTG